MELKLKRSFFIRDILKKGSIDSGDQEKKKLSLASESGCCGSCPVNSPSSGSCSLISSARETGTHSTLVRPDFISVDLNQILNHPSSSKSTSLHADHSVWSTLNSSSSCFTCLSPVTAPNSSWTSSGYPSSSLLLEKSSQLNNGSSGRNNNSSSAHLPPMPSGEYQSSLNGFLYAASVAAATQHVHHHLGHQPSPPDGLFGSHQPTLHPNRHHDHYSNRNHLHHNNQLFLTSPKLMGINQSAQSFHSNSSSSSDSSSSSPADVTSSSSSHHHPEDHHTSSTDLNLVQNKTSDHHLISVSSSNHGTSGTPRNTPLDSESGSSGRKMRRNRTVFTELQLMGLERRFDSQKYLSTPDRADLARVLGLTQLQVKTWYQNRRMKWKKQVMLGGCLVPPTKPKGRPKKNSIPSLGLIDSVGLFDGLFLRHQHQQQQMHQHSTQSDNKSSY